MDLMCDVRWTFRNLRRSPGFSAAAILTFGLGIGVNLAVLAVVDRMMFRPLPYGEADSLVHLYNMQTTGGPSPSAYLPRMVTEALQGRAMAFVDIATANGFQRQVTFEGTDMPLRFNEASANLLKVLQVTPIAGRDFTLEDAQSGSGGRALLLSDETWQHRFDRSLEVLSKSFRAGAVTYRVVGILPRGFLIPASSFEGRVDGVVVEPASTQPAGPAALGPSAIGRLRRGTTVQQAQAEVDVLTAQMKQNEPASIKSPVIAQPVRSGLFQFYRPYVWLILTAVGAVFLVACVNLATLFLARGRSREQDAAIRAALGASRGQIVRTSMAEAGVLCLFSAAAAVIVCYATSGLVLTVVPPALTSVAASPMDVRLIVMTSMAALATAIFAGGLPALRASRVDVTEGLRRDRPSTGSRLRGGASLLAVESAFGVFLVAGAAITVQSFLGLILKSPGYEPANLYEASVQHGWSREHKTYPPDRVQRAVDAIRRFPGVEGVGAVNRMPVGRTLLTDDPFWKTRGKQGIRLGVSGGFFAALRTPLLAGREFVDDDVNQMALMAIVSESAALNLFPMLRPGDVVGKTVVTQDGPRTIIGVVEDMSPMPGTAASPAFYVPLTATEVPRSGSAITMAIRMTAGLSLDAIALDARLDEQLSPNNVPVRPVATALDLQMQQPRFQALLFGSVAVIGLVLAAIGLYAVAAFDVARRRHEMGIRLSLGATAADLRRLVLASALRPVVIGAAAGLIGAWWAAQFLQAFVFEVDGRSPITYVLVALVLIVTAVFAAWRPAQRAARTDPTTVLRSL